MDIIRAAMRHARGRGGDTLVEVGVAIIVFAISALCLFPLFGAVRATGERGTFQIQALGLVEGRVNALVADLSLGEANSPLFKAMPLDFTARYVAASGNSSAPWTLSTSAAYDSISVSGLTGYQLQTTVQYFDDPSDGVGAADVNGDPHDALIISVRVVPVKAGASNGYPTSWLQTYWYRNP